MRVLDLFCGRWGWGREFARRGHEVVGIDLVESPEIPQGCTFVQANILNVRYSSWGFWVMNGPILGHFDFICASSPCEQFSVHGMKHFHPNPKYPDMGINLFNHTRFLCEASRLPYVMENVRAAQQFVGKAVNHCGPFYLWGKGIPPLMPQGIKKGMNMGSSNWDRATNYDYAKRNGLMMAFNSKSKERAELTAAAATIPPELASCVAEYAERICEAPTCSDARD